MKCEYKMVVLIVEWF